VVILDSIFGAVNARYLLDAHAWLIDFGIGDVQDFAYNLLAK